MNTHEHTHTHTHTHTHIHTQQENAPASPYTRHKAVIDGGGARRVRDGAEEEDGVTRRQGKTERGRGGEGEKEGGRELFELRRSR